MEVYAPALHTTARRMKGHVQVYIGGGGEESSRGEAETQGTKCRPQPPAPLSQQLCAVDSWSGSSSHSPASDLPLAGF